MTIRLLLEQNPAIPNALLNVKTLKQMRAPKGATFQRLQSEQKLIGETGTSGSAARESKI